MNLQLTDWITLMLYYAVIIYIGFYFARKQKSADQYFLAGRNSKWFAIGPTVFAANISSEHIIGLAGSGAAAGLAVGAYEWVAVFCLFTLSWLLAPYYLKSKVFTMPEFLQKRYNPQCRWYLSILSIIAYIFTKISVALFAGAILLKALLGWDIIVSSTILAIATGIYTIAGGLSAIIYSDMIHTIVLILGSLILTIIGLEKVGGFAGLQTALPADFFDMTKPASHDVYPWTGATLGIFILGIWYWGTDQFVVQKTLSAKGLGHARGGLNLTAFLKILPVFIFVLPGLIAKVLWPEPLASSPDQAYPMLVTQLIPKGFTGIMVAALIAALMSSLSAVFNSCSTLITMDIYRKINTRASDKKLVWLGRIFTVIMVIISIAWVPLIDKMGDQLYQYMQSVQAYISPPIASVFLLGILWKGTTSRAALSTLIIGGILGISRFGLDILLNTTNMEMDFLSPILGIAFLNYCIILFVICLILLVSISLFDKKFDTSRIKYLVFDKKEINKGTTLLWNTINIIVSILIALTVISLWVKFS